MTRGNRKVNSLLEYFKSGVNKEVKEIGGIYRKRPVTLGVRSIADTLTDREGRFKGFLNATFSTLRDESRTFTFIPRSKTDFKTPEEGFILIIKQLYKVTGEELDEGLLEKILSK